MNNAIISGRDIVIVGQQAWDVAIGSNCKDIAVEFAKHNRVLYVNSPLDRITSITHRHNDNVKKRLAVINRKEEALIRITENLWTFFPNCLIESINWITIQPLFEFFNKVNNKKFAASIRTAINKLNFNNVILFNDNDIFRVFHLKELLKPSMCIYYSRDYMLAFDYWRKHGTKLEPELIAKSNVCVANSVYLTNYCKKYNPNSFYVGQGCQLEAFTNMDLIEVPADLKGIHSPIIGYVGALHHIRLDMCILDFIATSNPQWNIVLVGPEDDEFKKSILHKLKNIYFIGSKNPKDLHTYIQTFDVCINPQLVNELTIGNYPRKIDEYLAAGKPVVATKTEAMSIFSEYVYLPESKEEYITFIQKALEEQDETFLEKRKAFAMSHTWENSVGEIYKAINLMVG